jgi:hypothetical protein
MNTSAMLFWIFIISVQFFTEIEMNEQFQSYSNRTGSKKLHFALIETNKDLLGREMPSSKN